MPNSFNKSLGNYCKSSKPQKLSKSLANIANDRHICMKTLVLVYNKEIVVTILRYVVLLLIPTSEFYAVLQEGLTHPKFADVTKIIN
mmetsp:Transcript_23560/g.29692  ORF Transcript_23560/g.29692 Transcript_23560/m.29692 type:complete len:87 (-) Transcript_23560:383-643(-)